MQPYKKLFEMSEIRGGKVYLEYPFLQNDTVKYRLTHNEELKPKLSFTNKNLVLIFDIKDINKYRKFFSKYSDLKFLNKKLENLIQKSK